MKTAYIDIETTGLPPKGAKYDESPELFPHIVSIGWIVDIDGKAIAHEKVIKPDGYEIPVESTKIHGINTEMAEQFGLPLKKVLINFLMDITGADKIVGHNIYFDTSIIKANAIRAGLSLESFNKALHKDKRIDTMMKTIKFVGAKRENGGAKFPSLEELHEKLFGTKHDGSHTASADVLATRKCYLELIERGVIS